MPSVQSSRRQGLNSSAAIKVPCLAASTANLTLSGEQTVDGVALVSGDRVLVKDQTDGTENGIYEVDTSTWQRAKDWDGTFDVVTGTIASAINGTANADTMWRVTTTGTITVGSTSVSFERAAVNDSSTVAFSQSGTGAVSVTVQSKLREITSVLDYNAAGDAATDDASAIQAALDSGAISVYFPDARYYCVSGLSIPAGVKIYGENFHTTEIFTDQDITLITLGGHRVSIEEIFLQQTSAVGTSVGVSGSDKYWFNTKNLRIDGFKYGVNMDKALYHTHIFPMWDGCTVNCRYHATGTTWNVDWYNNQIVFINPRFNQATDTGFYFRGVGLTLISPDASACTNYGFDIAGQATNQRARDITIISPYVEQTDVPFNFQYADIGINGGFLQGGSAISPYTSPLVADDSIVTISSLNTGDYWTDYNTLTNGSKVIQTDPYSAAGSSANVDSTSLSVINAYDENSSFTFTLTGCTTSPTGTAYYAVQGNLVTLYIPSIAGTSNSTAATLTGLPSNLYPSRNQRLYIRALDSGANFDGSCKIDSSGNFVLYKTVGLGAFTASGSKGIGECTISYLLN